jgi:hypothetical protein
MRVVATAAARESAGTCSPAGPRPAGRGGLLILVGAGSVPAPAPIGGDGHRGTPADALVELAGDYAAPGGAVVLASFAE